MISNLLREELKSPCFGDASTRSLVRAAAERIEELEKETPKRIEMMRLLQELRQDDEAPGDTILRALLVLRACNNS